MVNETGSGKPAMAGVRSSTEVRFGPDPRISIQARGRQSAALQRPDTRQHLTACLQPSKENACINGGVHTRQHLTACLQPSKENACINGGVHTRSCAARRRTPGSQDAVAQAAQAGRGGAGQPDGAHCLGADDEQRGLPGSRRRLSGRRSAGSRRGCGQDGGQGKGKWSTRRGRENQPWPACAQARKSDLDPIRVSPYRPAAGKAPHSRGRTHDST